MLALYTIQKNKAVRGVPGKILKKWRKQLDKIFLKKYNWFDD